MDQQIVVIIGSSSGIGYEVARQARAQGARLIIAEREFSGSVPLKRLATVEEVASTYMHFMNNGFITGQVLSVDGGVMLRK